MDGIHRSAPVVAAPGHASAGPPGGGHHQTRITSGASGFGSDMVRVLAVLRRFHLVVADRFVARGWLDDRSDYFLVQLPEIAAVIDGRAPPASLRPIVARRRAEQERYRSMRMPLLMKEADLPRLLRASSVSGVADLDGDSAHRAAGQRRYASKRKSS